jgi:tetratricopeptide (TPR) repeat protein/predicted Ser/Thr protein kinase/TolB-like protein
MICPQCKTDNPASAATCVKCSTPFPFSDQTLAGTLAGGSAPTSNSPTDSADQTIADSTAAWSIAVTPSAVAAATPGEQLVGAKLADRYEIMSLLGEGGMGAVYKARDTELDRLVAIKLIRPDLATNPEILHRFKQELILAREVTHRNVIRIFDLGHAKGVKFITMQFVEGRDLRTALREKGKFTPEEAVQVISQVCRALEVAHAAGVVHRDLKPQNIMLDATDRVYVMDFGIAHSLETPGMTQTGALMGTPEYMSPEQAKGMKVDARSDLFALGIIFYELLTGISPFKADTAMATLLKRLQERPKPPVEVDPAIPQGISDVVMKCLEIDRDQRYSNAREILEDLGLEMPTSVRTVATTFRPPATIIEPEKASTFVQYRTWIFAGAGVAVLLLATLAFALRSKIFAAKPAAPVEQTALAILPFRNASGDASLDYLGTGLADMLSTDVGQSAGLRTISPDRLHQVLSDLKITPDVVIDPATLNRIKEFSPADTFVSGEYKKFDNKIQITAALNDIKHDRRVPLIINAEGESDIPHAVDGLAELIRKNMNFSADVVKALNASSFRPSTTSVPALREYNQGLELQREGKTLEAKTQFDLATKEDPTFALAYSKLAQTFASLGYDNEAEQNAGKAVNASQNLPDTEKFLIAAVRAQIDRNLPEAIKAYGKLAEASPNNADVQAALADLYEQSGDLAKAAEFNQKVLAANPKDITATMAMGRLSINGGNAQAGLDALNKALTLSIAADNQEQRAKSLHLIGVAYWRMNKPQEALRNYQEELPIWTQLGEKRGLALCLNETAKVQALLGDKNALSNFQQALQIRNEIGDKRGQGSTSIDLGNLYNDRGDHDQALKMYKEALQIQRDLSNERLQAICLNNIGAVYFEKGQYEDARAYYQQALTLREKAKAPGDIVQSVQNLADTDVRMGQFDQAITSYMHALDLWRSMNDARGAAITSNTLGTMLDFQGRFGAAVKSKQDAFKTFSDLKDKTTWMAEVGGGYGEALVLAGRNDDSKPYLSDALSLSRELKNDGMVAQTLAYQGDAAYYRGDSKSARSLYEQALEAATRSKEPARILVAKVAIAKIAATEGPAPQAIATLRQLTQQADDQGVPNISIDCAISIGEAMIRSHDNAHAQQQIERALVRADKLSLKPLSARAHYLLGGLLRAMGNQTDAEQNYRDALQLLDAMRQDPGAEKILERADFKAMHDDAARGAQTAKN